MALLMGAIPVFACTSVIASGRVTPDLQHDLPE